MRLFSFAARQNGKRRALDLVASELAELQQRSQMPAAEDPFYAELHRRMSDQLRPQVVSEGWCAPGDYGGLLDLPLIGVERGSVSFAPRPAPDKSWLEMGSIRDY